MRRVVEICVHRRLANSCIVCLEACPVCGKHELEASYLGEAICSSCFGWLDNLNTIGALAHRIWDGITRHGPDRLPPCCWSTR